MRLISEHGVASIPVSPFLQRRASRGPGAALLLREARRDARARGRTPAARLGLVDRSHGGRWREALGCSLTCTARRQRQERPLPSRQPFFAATRDEPRAGAAAAGAVMPTVSGGPSCTSIRSAASAPATGTEIRRDAAARAAALERTLVARDGRPVTDAPTSAAPTDADVEAVRGGGYGRCARPVLDHREQLRWPRRDRRRPSNPNPTPSPERAKASWRAASAARSSSTKPRRSGARRGHGHRRHQLWARSGGAAEQGRHGHAVRERVDGETWLPTSIRFTATGGRCCSGSCTSIT